LNVEFSESFLKDLKAVKDKSVLAKVKAAIEASEQADTLDQITQLKKMRGSREYFRIRIGDFRLGLKLEGDTLVFIRFLNRKDIYRYFP
jgi:mRNA interferase RelE/StbE